MQTKTKIITWNKPETLEKLINEYVKNIPTQNMVDIKYTITDGGEEYMYSALIIHIEEDKDQVVK